MRTISLPTFSRSSSISNSELYAFIQKHMKNSIILYISPDGTIQSSCFERKFAGIGDYPGYFADSDGNIYRSTDSEIINDLRVCCAESVRKHQNGGYETVSMIRRDFERVTVNVHTIICAAFHGLPPAPGLQVRHLNGNGLCNRADNLAYGTARQNWNDKYACGTATCGERNPMSKLTDLQRMEIICLWKNGAKQTEIARSYGVTQSAISKIVRKAV